MFGLNKASSTPAGGLFGQASGASTGNANTGFSFGGTQTGQNTGPSTGGLFGAKPAGSTGGSGASFGQQQQQSQTNAFGGSATTGGGLFGNKPNNTANTGGGLFGANSNSNSGGLFGSNNAQTSGGLFGNNNTNNINNSSSGMNNASTGLFGSKPAGGTSLFGNTSTSSAPAQNQGMFGAKPGATSLFGNNAGNTTTGGGLFGSKPTGATSLFGSSNNNNNNNSNNIMSASGGLFGNQQQQLQQQPQMQCALQNLSQLPITPMTRISELPPQIRQEIEQLDQYIQKQVQISHHLKADTIDHDELIDSIPRDVAYLLKSESATSQYLKQDLKKISSFKSLIDEDLLDTQTFSVLLQQLLTPGSKISSNDLDKFFQKKIHLYEKKLEDYCRILSDIETAVNGIDTDLFGAPNNPNSTAITADLGSSEAENLLQLKTGLAAIVSTVIEEFTLFMDIAERIAVLHQKTKTLAPLSI
ncbi:AMM_1a_G0018300.mRNA.1.CDS.1 [Saccharomyces cerevisiae]|nr:AMM_1a_G0018300.mRNA.1.CDS.1 [Saccharomyces cerevisiae]CAI6656513.1 AMM_1a_G0018300.mRNA.1.CDS.1 [Saccharomyces cerevisiae]